MSYDYGEFLEAVRRQTAERLREPGGLRAPRGWATIPPCVVCWAAEVLWPLEFRRQRDSCLLVSGKGRDAHHLIPKQVLKREFPRGHDGRDLDEILMDARNGVLVSRYHHDALEQRQVVLTRDLWPADALEFVRELGLAWWVDKMSDRARRA